MSSQRSSKDPPLSFTEQNAPKHEALDGFKTPFSERLAPTLEKSKTPGESAQHVKKKDLLETYLPNLQELFRDAEQRSDHYSQAQHDAIAKLRREEVVDTRTRSELLMTFVRKMEPARLAKEQQRKATAPKTEEPSEEADGEEDVPTFEEQDANDTIKII